MVHFTRVYFFVLGVQGTFAGGLTDLSPGTQADGASIHHAMSAPLTICTQASSDAHHLAHPYAEGREGGRRSGVPSYLQTGKTRNHGESCAVTLMPMCAWATGLGGLPRPAELPGLCSHSPLVFVGTASWFLVPREVGSGAFLGTASRPFPQGM